MPTLRSFFLAAKHGSTIVATIVGQTVGTGGALSAGTSGSIRGQFKKWKITSSPKKDNISSNDSALANNVILEEDFKVELEEMQVRGIGSQVLSVLISSFDYFAVTLAYGNKTYGPIYLSRGEFSDGIEDKGNGNISLSLELIDVGQTAVLPYVEA